MLPIPGMPSDLCERITGWARSVHRQTEHGTIAWRLERDGEVRFLKLLASGRYPSLDDERVRLEWAAGRLSVPRVHDYGEAEGTEWLILQALPGRDATQLTSNPEGIVRLLGEGLRAFHEADVSGCPFDFTLDAALAHVRRRAGDEWADAPHEEFRHFTPREAIAHLEATRPATEDVVLCHGDYCFPNVLVDGGRITGYIDLGELGLADRWWDLAVATWSCTWNLGPGYEEAFLDAYGVARDEERSQFYRLLYELAS